MRPNAPIPSPLALRAASPRIPGVFARSACVALDHGMLHFECAAHGVHHAAELDDAAVAGAFDDAAMVHGDCGVNQIAAQRAQSRQGSIFVCSGKPRIADHVGHQDRGQFSGPAHGATRPRPCQPFRVVGAKPLGGIAKTREECRSMARAWLHIHAALGRTWKRGVQVLRFDWPVYPRRAEHNTVAEGGNRRSTIAASSQAFAHLVGLVLLHHGPQRERPGNRLERLDADRDAIMRQARRASDLLQPAYFLCSLHGGRQRTAGPLASRTLGRSRSGHRREREATCSSPSC